MPCLIMQQAKANETHFKTEKLPHVGWMLTHMYDV
jgi:hypothetical protein